MHKRICLAQQKEKLQLGTKQKQKIDMQQGFDSTKLSSMISY